MKLQIKESSEPSAFKVISFVVRTRTSFEHQVLAQTLDFYEQDLKERFGFLKIEKTELNKSRIRFRCQTNKKKTEENATADWIVTYVNELGFFSIGSIADLEKLEQGRIMQIDYEHHLRRRQKEAFEKYQSFKVPISKEKFKRLRNHLSLVRDLLEGLTYTEDNPEKLQNWQDKFEECETILNNQNYFFLDLGLVMLVNRKVKKELLYFSDFYENAKKMRDSHQSGYY